ncbi:hypothetical protein pb186bvf_003885 [Paramecium bursaria]
MKFYDYNLKKNVFKSPPKIKQCFKYSFIKEIQFDKDYSKRKTDKFQKFMIRNNFKLLLLDDKENSNGIFYHNYSSQSLYGTKFNGMCNHIDRSAQSAQDML